MPEAVARSLCLVVLDHRNDEFLRETVDNVRALCPGADVAWYDSGTGGGATPPGVARLAASRPLQYAKVAPFFFDLLEWAAEVDYDYVVNLETDLAFVRTGFEGFVAERLREAHHLAPRFRADTSPRSRWRPYRSLKPELSELVALLRTWSTDRCFSPGQGFSRNYAQTVVSSSIYPALREFVEANQHPSRSFSLQEVLMPTLTRVLGLRIATYPAPADRFNRYRPYHSAGSVGRAVESSGVYFVHPIRRDGGDSARQAVREFMQRMSA